MERDDVIIALAKLQSTQEEILRRFDENKVVTEKIDARVQKLESSLSYIYGAIAIVGFLSTLFWDFISKRFTT